MEYKRKLSTQQEGVNGTDSEFGALKIIGKSKRLMPIIFTIVMIIFIIGLFVSQIKIPENIIATILLVLFLLLGAFQLATLLDKIEFYEYGLIDYTFFNLRKKRIAYDEIEAIVEVKKHFLFKAENRQVIALWKIFLKNNKNSLVIDATSYIGITQIMTSLRHDTKIKNIAD